MESSQNEATAQHQRDSWAQSAEEARLARLKQLEVMHGYDSDPGKLPHLVTATKTYTYRIAIIITSKIRYHGDQCHWPRKSKIQA